MKPTLSVDIVSINSNANGAGVQQLHEGRAAEGKDTSRGYSRCTRCSARVRGSQSAGVRRGACLRQWQWQCCVSVSVAVCRWDLLAAVVQVGRGLRRRPGSGWHSAPSSSWATAGLPLQGRRGSPEVYQLHQKRGGVSSFLSHRLCVCALVLQVVVMINCVLK